jgi:hypothetical protein
MRWRRLSNGFFNPTGALFAVTVFSCSDGKFPSGGHSKSDPVTLFGRCSSRRGHGLVWHIRGAGSFHTICAMPLWAAKIGFFM